MKALTSVSAFVGSTFAAWVILLAVLGFVFPETFNQFGSWIVTLLGIMFGMGLTLPMNDYWEVVKRPFDVTIGVLWAFPHATSCHTADAHHPKTSRSGGGRHPGWLLPRRNGVESHDLSLEGPYCALGRLHVHHD